MITYKKKDISKPYKKISLYTTIKFWIMVDSYQLIESNT